MNAGGFSLGEEVFTKVAVLAVIFVSEPFDDRDVIECCFVVGNSNQDVDDGLGDHSGDGSASDMLNVEDAPKQSDAEQELLPKEHPSPLPIIRYKVDLFHLRLRLLADAWRAPIGIHAFPSLAYQMAADDWIVVQGPDGCNAGEMRPLESWGLIVDQADNGRN